MNGLKALQHTTGIEVPRTRVPYVALCDFCTAREQFALTWVFVLMTISSNTLPALLLTGVDWAGLVAIKVSPLELFLRGSAMYLGIIVIMRVFRRQKGAMNAPDLVVLLLVADAAQNALSANYNSISEGAIVVGTLFLWAFVLDTLAFYSRPLRHLINGQPVTIVQDGQFNRLQMRRDMLTTDDVMEQLREQGVDDVRQVLRCYLETDGHFSVIKRDGAPTDQPQSNPLSVQ